MPRTPPRNPFGTPSENLRNPFGTPSEPHLRFGISAENRALRSFGDQIWDRSWARAVQGLNA
eukprot:2041520-Alexandrium_andersonii.AAC.1